MTARLVVTVFLAGALVSGVAHAAQERPAGPSGAPAASLAQLRAAVTRDPGNPKLQVDLGLAYWERNDYAHALQAFQRAVKVGPQYADAHNWLGVALAGKADLPGAIAEFKQAIALAPKYGRAYTNLGSALAKAGDFDAAVTAFQSALTLEPNSVAAHLNLGMALREKGDLEGALRHLRPVAAANPDNPNIQYELGQTLRQNGDLPGAVAAFEKSIALEPELREGYYGLGQALKEQSASAARSRASFPASPADDLVTRAQELVGQGDLTAARDQLTAATARDDTNAVAQNLLGFILGQQHDLSSAVAHLQRATTLQPEWAEAHYNLGVALWYSGDKEKSLTELRRAAALDPAAGACQAFLGNALRDTGDLAGGRVSLQRAIAVLPPTAAVYVDLGITYLRAKELDHALGQFEAALNLPASAQPTPDWDSAITGLQAAVTANPNAAEAHNVLGLLLGRKSADSALVVAEFRAAIRLRPDFAEAQNNLGLVLLQAGDDAAGIAALREAVRLSPDYADAHDNLGAALTPTDAAEAVRELETAVRLAPASVKALYNLAIAYAASPGLPPAKSIDQLRKVIDLDPTFSRAHLALGKALVQQGTLPEALDHLQQAAKLDPDNGEAHYQLGLALARAGRKDDATAELQKGRDLVAASDRSQNARMDVADGHAALERGELTEAAAKFNRAIQLGPPSAEAQAGLGAVLERQHDGNGAVAAYRKALALDPAEPGAAEGLQRLTSLSIEIDDRDPVPAFEAQIREGRFKEVEPLLTEYVSTHATSSWAWYALGYSQFAQQKIGESIKSLAKSLELDVTNANAHKILGRDLMIVGRFDVAQVEFEQGIRYQPNSAEIHYNLGKLHSIQDNWEPARKEFEAAVRIDPTYLEALDALGLALEALGHDEDAVADYEKAMALNEARHGTFASAHVNLSAYYNRTDHPDKALDYATKALELDPRSDRALFQKARAEERQGHLEAAVASLNSAIAINPHASSYFYVLAGVYRRLGWNDESQKALETFKRLDRESSELDKLRRGASGTGAASQPGQQREHP